MNDLYEVAQPVPRPVQLFCLGLFIAVAVWLVDAHSAHACTPPPGWSPPPLSQRYAQASHVIHGRIFSIGSRAARWSVPVTFAPEVSAAEHFRLWYRFAPSAETDYGYYALVEVEGYYKGGGGPLLAIWGFGYGPDCMNTARPGQEVILFADGRAPFLDLHYQGPQTAVMEADPAALAELAQLTDKPPQPPQTAVEVLWLPVVLAVIVMTPIGLRGAWALMSGRGLRAHWRWSLSQSPSGQASRKPMLP